LTSAFCPPTIFDPDFLTPHLQPAAVVVEDGDDDAADDGDDAADDGDDDAADDGDDDAADDGDDAAADDGDDAADDAGGVNDLEGGTTFVVICCDTVPL